MTVIVKVVYLMTLDLNVKMQITDMTNLKQKINVLVVVIVMEKELVLLLIGKFLYLTLKSYFRC